MNKVLPARVGHARHPIEKCQCKRPRQGSRLLETRQDVAQLGQPLQRIGQFQHALLLGRHPAAAAPPAGNPASWHRRRRCAAHAATAAPSSRSASRGWSAATQIPPAPAAPARPARPPRRRAPGHRRARGVRATRKRAPPSAMMPSRPSSSRWKSVIRASVPTAAGTAGSPDFAAFAGSGTRRSRLPCACNRAPGRDSAVRKCATAAARRETARRTAETAACRSSGDSDWATIRPV